MRRASRFRVNFLRKNDNFFQKPIDKPRPVCYNVIRCDAAMAQLVEHILGKDEVPSSNLGSSSRKVLAQSGGDFLAYTGHSNWYAFASCKGFYKRFSIF